MEVNDDDEYVFQCSGRVAYANRLMISINPELDVDQGYDGSFGCYSGDFDGSALTTAEKIELADYMIGLWNRYKDSASENR